MEIDDQIRAKLLDYLAGEIVLEELEGWLTPATWDLDATHDPIAEGLASRILLRLSEFSNGDLTEDELRADLEPLVRLQARPSQATFAGATSPVVAAGHLGTGSSAARTSPEEVFG